MSNLLTNLQSRLLRYDGVSVAHPDDVAFLLCQGVQPNMIQVSGIDRGISLFNEQVPLEDQIIEFSPDNPVHIDLGWLIPESYKKLDLQSYVIERFSEFVEKKCYNEVLLEAAINRVDEELKAIDDWGMEMFFKSVIYIIDTLKQNNQVWGVGRGSSCASYILYILGLHKVDCVLLDVPSGEFFHD